MVPGAPRPWTREVGPVGPPMLSAQLQRGIAFGFIPDITNEIMGALVHLIDGVNILSQIPDFKKLSIDPDISGDAALLND